MRLLLKEHGADVNIQDTNHLTPLLLASSVGPTETARLLIEHEANVNEKNENHWMPLHLASSRGSAKIMQLLIEHGVDVNANDKTFSISRRPGDRPKLCSY